jgi:uncharacterized protein YjbI with pentapeptide repeats
VGEGGQECGVEGCCGSPFGPFPKCFAHLGPQARARALRDLGPGSDVDVSRTELTAELVAEIRDAVRSEDGHPVFGDARFDDTVFTTVADFGNAAFEGGASFLGAVFRRGADFSQANFADRCDLFDVKFCERAEFWGAVFAGEAVIKGTFDDVASFFRVTFKGAVDLSRSDFRGSAMFDGAQFEDALGLTGVRLALGATFEGAHFAHAEGLGPIYSDGPLNFDRAVFDGGVTIDAETPELSFVGTRVAGAAVLRLHGANVWLDAAILGDTTTVVSADIPRQGAEPPADLSRDHLLGTTSIGSLRGVDASKLVLSGVDLSQCRFSGSYNLDRIRIEGRCKFADVPRGVRIRRAWPPVWWWTKRQTIIEEHRWRYREGRIPDGWTAQYPERPDSTAGWRQPTHPERLAAVYRQLRKAFEDAKNEPGAADFYYAEMEMRRLSPTTPRSERFVLTLYWLFSGYGLRASRALLGLVALVGVTTWVLVTHGLAAGDANTEEALRSALNAVVFRSDDAELTTAGVYVEMVARVCGPILLALAALSVRNRVKR